MPRFVLISILLVCTCALCFAQEAEPAEQNSDAGPFRGTWADSVWTVISFVTLLIVLRFTAWKPLLSSLKAREDHIRKQLDDAEDVRKKAEDQLAQYNAKLADAERQAEIVKKERLAQTQKQADQIIDQAKTDAEQIKQKGVNDVQAAASRAKDQLWHEAGDIVLRLGEEVLSRNIRTEDNQMLLEKAIDKFRESERGRD